MKDMCYNPGEMYEDDSSAAEQWFVMRDLTRSNAKMPAYVMLNEMNIRCFTPMVNKIVIRNNKRIRKEVPYMHDLIFVYAAREILDPIVAKINTFQYRYLRERLPMTVRKKDMERFIKAVEHSESPRYYRTDELTSDMFRRRIRIIGGQLDGYEGYLLTMRGSKVKRLLVELPTLLAAAVEVEPEYVQLI